MADFDVAYFICLHSLLCCHESSDEYASSTISDAHKLVQPRTPFLYVDFPSQNGHCARKVVRFDDCTFRRGYLHVLLGRLHIKS
jgi:hypothetical protein